MRAARHADWYCKVVGESPPPRRAAGASAQSRDEEFLALLKELPAAGFADKEAIVERLMATGHPGASAALSALLEDRLYSSADSTVVIVKSTEEGLTTYDLIDPVSLNERGSAPARKAPENRP